MSFMPCYPLLPFMILWLSTAMFYFSCLLLFVVFCIVSLSSIHFWVSFLLALYIIIDFVLILLADVLGIAV